MGRAIARRRPEHERRGAELDRVAVGQPRSTAKRMPSKEGAVIAAAVLEGGAVTFNGELRMTPRDTVRVTRADDRVASKDVFALDERNLVLSAGQPTRRRKP